MLGKADLTRAASQYLLRLNQQISNISYTMIQSSHLCSVVLSALFALPFVAEMLLPGSLRAAEDEKIEFPAASQHAVVKQRVGLTDVEVDYSRPNKNDREIFGGLVPYGKLWRTGANAVTKIKFSQPVTLGGKEIPAGEYALFTIPTADEWIIIVSKDAKVQSAADYKQENDAARVTAKPEAIASAQKAIDILKKDKAPDESAIRNAQQIIDSSK